jgi:flagellar biosynthetic protein FlhB
MPAGHDQDKTEPATPKKRQEARKKGQVAKSREVSSVLVLLSALSVFYFAGGWMFNQVAGIMKTVFGQAGQPDFGVQNAHALLWFLFQKFVGIMAPLLAVVAVAGIVGNIAQVGFLLSGEPLTPKLSKLNPFKGIKRLVSIKASVEVVKAILKVIIIGGVAYLMIHGEMTKIPALVTVSVSSIVDFMGQVALKLGYYTCLVLIILAAIDFVFQRWQHERDLRMTKQEVKDEFRQREGDPMIRSRIRAIQRELAMSRMMDAVPDATVVITNPTHLAVALKFDRSMQAPMVVAKGAGHLAERIKGIAAEHDIPVIEQKPLARALFKNVEIDHYISADLYHAVAEILAYVYQLKGLVH